MRLDMQQLDPCALRCAMLQLQTLHCVGMLQELSLGCGCIICSLQRSRRSDMMKCLVLSAPPSKERAPKAHAVSLHRSEE